MYLDDHLSAANLNFLLFVLFLVGLAAIEGHFFTRSLTASITLGLKLTVMVIEIPKVSLTAKRKKKSSTSPYLPLERTKVLVNKASKLKLWLIDSILMSRDPTYFDDSDSSRDSRWNRLSRNIATCKHKVCTRRIKQQSNKAIKTHTNL